jgi:hypothetical protein
MSSPRYSGTIELPARFIDHEVQELLAKEYEVRFKEPDLKEIETEEDDLEAGVEIEPTRKPEQELELAETVSDWIEVKIVDGVFFFHDGEARYGEFCELEELLIKKGIPFDRESGMDWNAPPAMRIFRPGPPVLDHTDSTPNSYDEVVSVRDIRERLMGVPAEDENVGLIAYKKLINLLAFLDAQFPAYPPLTDFVGEN